MKVKEHYWDAHMEQERQQQEMEEHMYALTMEALIEAAKHLKQEQMDVLMYHCGFTDNDLKGAAKNEIRLNFRHF